MTQINLSVEQAKAILRLSQAGDGPPSKKAGSMPQTDLPTPATAVCRACGSTGLVAMTLAEMLTPSGRGRDLDGGRRCRRAGAAPGGPGGCECWHDDEATPGDCAVLTWRPCDLACPVYRLALRESRLAGNAVEYRHGA